MEKEGQPFWLFAAEEHLRADDVEEAKGEGDGEV
jgi:hypothetical protein